MSDTIRLPVERSWASRWYLDFVVRTPRREEPHRFLADHGIETSIHYEVPVYLIGPIRSAYGYERGDFPIADRVCSEILSLPVGPWFTEDQIDHVADQVQAFFRS
jgi:dTDP-4-amino-4,6-dideoxygalactose transaminase